MLLRTKKAVFARKVISLTPQKGIFLPKTSLKQPKAPSNKSAFKKNCQQQMFAIPVNNKRTSAMLPNKTCGRFPNSSARFISFVCTHRRKRIDTFLEL